MKALTDKAVNYIVNSCIFTINNEGPLYSEKKVFTLINQFCNRYSDTLFERVGDSIDPLMFELRINPNRIGTEAETQYNDLVSLLSKHCMSKDENNSSGYSVCRFDEALILVAK